MPTEVNSHKINFKGFSGAMFWAVIGSILCFLVAFSTEGWAELGKAKMGLWKTCVCGPSNSEAWFKATQAMFAIAFISMCATLVLAVLYMIFHSFNKNLVLFLLILSCCISVLLQLTGLLIFGIEVEKTIANLSFSFVFACLSTILCFLAGGMAVVQRIRSR